MSRPDALREGLALQRAGQHDQARLRYQEALRERPDRAFAAHALGCCFIALGLGLTSVPFLRRAFMLQPAVASHGEALLHAFVRSARLDDAESLLDEAEARGLGLDLASWRRCVRACREGADPATLGLVAPVALDPERLSEPADRALDWPTETPVHASLAEPFAEALQAHAEGRMRDLVAILDPLIDRDPDWGEGRHLRGLAWMALGRIDPAVSELREASRLLPGRPEVWDHLGIALARQEDFPGVLNAYEQSLALRPLRPESWSNAADALMGQERHEEAYQYAFQAARLQPDQPAFVLNLGRAAKGVGNLTYARALLQRLLDGVPDHVTAIQQLGEIALLEGGHDEALALFERVISVDPDNQGVQSGLVFLHNYLGTETQARICARARAYGTWLARDLPPPAPWSNLPDLARRLRVGFVSGDLRTHPVGRFFSAVATALARDPSLERFAYPTTRQADGLTGRIRAAFDHWTCIAGLDDEEAAARIRADGIDILVDLSGHTGKHRLDVFARKPAPLQITWLGYFGTTGLTQIDYLLAGPWDVPPAEESEFVERIWRLPHTQLCFSRPDSRVAVAPLPAARAGHITFGCFNNLRKLNPRVVALWGRVLAAVADARLLLKSKELQSEQTRAAVQARFAAVGVAPERLILEGSSAYDDYLASYGRVDIALDPFPYTGGTTSIESLWMGVPVLTLAGDRLLARQGEGMLRVLGLDDWVASSPDDYVAKAIRHAGARDALADLRSGLRARVEASPLMDAPRFATDLGAAFRAIWARWCDSRIAAPERVGVAGPRSSDPEVAS